jgi:hypothetical protein
VRHGHPDFEGRLGADAVDAQCRQQAHHATRHTQGRLGRRPVLAECASGQAVDAAGDALELAGGDQPAQDHGRQSSVPQIAYPPQRVLSGERQGSAFQWRIRAEWHAASMMQ